MKWTVVKILLFSAFTFSIAWITRSILKIISTEAPDFRILWSFATHLRQGQNLYLTPDILIPNPYPPFTFLFYLPFTLIPYTQAQGFFIFLIFASFIATTLLSLQIATNKISLLGFVATLTLVLFSFPAKFSLGMGQQNSIAYLLLLVSYHYWRKKVPLPSGIFLALSISLKPVLGFVALFFVTRRAWKTLFWAFGTIMVETVATLAISRVNFLKDWIVKTLVYIPLAGRGVYYNQGIAGFVSRIAQNMPLAQTLVALLSLLLLIALFATAKKLKDPNLIFSLFTISLLLIDTLSWQHHFVWLIFPFVVLTNKALKARNVFVSALIAIAYLLVSWSFKNPNTIPAIFLSTQFYGAVILWTVNIFVAG